jgi:hypothetical protein
MIASLHAALVEGDRDVARGAGSDDVRWALQENFRSKTILICEVA